EAVSLVEYQVSVLRDQIHDLRRRMQVLVANARDNEKLSQRLHRLTLMLAECKTLDEMLSTLYQGLEDDFDADFAVIRLFAAPSDAHDAGLGEFLGTDAPGRELFAQLLGSSRPLCGRVKSAQMAFLFPTHSAEIGSGALLPLGTTRRFGVLAIASRDAGRFHAGMGTIFLRQLADIVSHMLAPYVARAAQS
ncbi:MAG: DUF484 family protein, partial [Gammaproteobacteria bacterium]|nr:DUF484 family protein [Gammaproteobacteria bacterium]